MLVDVERRARLIGVNHVALEVGDLEAALALYGRLFEFELRGRAPGAAFIDMGDQFIAVMQGRAQPADDERHFGLVVDDVAAAREAVGGEGLAIVGDTGQSFDFLDPWGNRFQVVGYCDIQFERTAGVRRKLGIEQLAKTSEAQRQISERGLG
jgi:catechol 2,3-dioxygenase-like lactoylglutathione lyase family enzyme